jgi:hypothetical protein
MNPTPVTSSSVGAGASVGAFFAEGAAASSLPIMVVASSMEKLLARSASRHNTSLHGGGRGSVATGVGEAEGDSCAKETCTVMKVPPTAALVAGWLGVELRGGGDCGSAVSGARETKMKRAAAATDDVLFHSITRGQGGLFLSSS